jgi:hypothetical protein
VDPIHPRNEAIFIPLDNTWSREIEYVEKGIIVKVVDQCLGLVADPEHGSLTS